MCLIHSLATTLWLISLVPLSRPEAPETRRLLGKNKPNPWTPHPPGLLLDQYFLIEFNKLIYAYAAYNHYTLICLIFDTWLNSPWPVSLATNDNICSPNKLPAEKGKHSHNLIRMTNRVLIMTNIGQEWQRDNVFYLVTTLRPGWQAARPQEWGRTTVT